jgi:hypothetical protein
MSNNTWPRDQYSDPGGGRYTGPGGGMYTGPGGGLYTGPGGGLYTGPGGGLYTGPGGACTRAREVASIAALVAACTQGPAIGHIEATYRLGLCSLIILRNTE